MLHLPDSFKTIAALAVGEYKDKGSKFIATALPVQTEEEVKAIYADFRKKYYDARHVCYAYRLGATGDRFRANDDGEPSGTAGKPILGQLQSYELSNTLVLVVRYFGGTKLGTSGLITAYKSATCEALNNAEIVEQPVRQAMAIECSYDDLNAVMRIIKEENLDVLNQNLELSCVLHVACKLSATEKTVARFAVHHKVKTNLTEII